MFCRLCRNSSERQSGSGAAERAQRREWGEAFSEEMEAERVVWPLCPGTRGIECQNSTPEGPCSKDSKK